MDLESLNFRYVKLIRKMAAAVVLLLVTISPLSITRWSAEATGFDPRSAEADNSIPSLQGTAAITYLKQRKLYDSLKGALNAAGARPGHFSVLTPLFVNTQKLTAGSGALFDEFGYSIAICGSTVVVGARADTINGNLNQGSAYVFDRQGGSWVQAQKLTASDGTAQDAFGLSVACNGSTIVAGAFFHDSGGNLNQGAAYVFNRAGGRWVETQKLTSSDGAGGDSFGSAIAISGSTIVVSSPGDDIGGNFEQGSAYVFSRKGADWVEEQKLIPSDGVTNADFGFSVAISGSTVVVSALGTNSFQGSVYLFNRQGGRWVEEQKLTASDGETFDQFGHSVAISGSTLVVGAIGSNSLQGSTYVFNRQGGFWVEEQKLTASDGKARAEFGSAVAISGSTIVVGAQRDGNLSHGSAYVFERAGGGWVEAQKLTASEEGIFAVFGHSVAVSGSTILVGENNASPRGAVYVFEP